MFEPEGQETYTVYILMLNFRHNWGYLFVWLEMVGGESEYYEDVEQLLFLFPSIIGAATPTPQSATAACGFFFFIHVLHRFVLPYVFS